MHHAELNHYRKSGLDHFDLIEEAYVGYRTAADGLNRAYEAEIAVPMRDLKAIKLAYEVTKSAAEKELGDDLLILRDAIRQRAGEAPGNSIREEKLDRVISRLAAKLDQQRPALAATLNARRIPELKKLGQEHRAKIIDAVSNSRFEDSGDTDYYLQIKKDWAKAREISAGKAKSLLAVREIFGKELAAPLESIRQEALQHARNTRDQSRDNDLLPDRIRHQVKSGLTSQSVSVRQQRIADAIELIADAEHFDDFAKVFYVESLSYHLKMLRPDGSAYRSMPESTLQKTEKFLEETRGHFAEFLTVLRTPEPDLDAMLNSIPNDAMSPEQRILLFDLHRLEKGSASTIETLSEKAAQFVNAYPFDQRAVMSDALTKRFQVAVVQLKSRGLDELAKFPPSNSIQSKLARKELARFRENFEKNITVLEATGKKLGDWKFDRPWTWRETLHAFFPGQVWSTESEFQNFYGVFPLLRGSLIISIIALGVSVPISVAAALYVNQIARDREQSILNSAIKLMGAIPPVILGFLGIVVAGPLIKEFSSWPLLSWIPGFPFETRLNLLTAGLLLGFMACPILFTLVHDTLAKVPPTFREGALSLGASQLQIAFRVILPASLGGVIAAVVLGFSRVIGEAMIVLLVMSNRAATPGATEPVHTLPGTIAQNLRGASRASLDYHAIFMVGLVLFLITLVANYIGQKIFARHQIKSEMI